MKIINPNTAAHFQQRNLLLQTALRPTPLDFPITSEYPLALSESDPRFSFCVEDSGTIVSHANLFPREWVSIPPTPHKSRKVGLIGNVATLPSFRGQGIASKILGHCKNVALQQGMDALILWSDLSLFYQKLGYHALGAEHRLWFSLDSLSQTTTTGQIFHHCPCPADVDSESLLIHRLPVGATLKRSADEFSALKNIPQTHFFSHCKTGTSGPPSPTYGFLGRGFDMVGVIHEWGASTVEEFKGLLKEVLIYSGYQELIVLHPDPSLSEESKNSFASLKKVAKKHESHPMALVKPLGTTDKQKQVLEDLSCGFIWGLDSI